MAEGWQKYSKQNLLATARERGVVAGGAKYNEARGSGSEEYSSEPDPRASLYLEPPATTPSSFAVASRFCLLYFCQPSAMLVLAFATSLLCTGCELAPIVAVWCLSPLLRGLVAHLTNLDRSEGPLRCLTV